MATVSVTLPLCSSRHTHVFICAQLIGGAMYADTHATGVPSRLLTTANHFYQDVPGAWVCLQFTRTALRDAGIFVKDEEALPVGDKPVSADWVASNWVCPHVIGGIPAAVVEKEYPMIREGTSYVAIESLC
jgi:hypothetical protein